ncbi:MAG: suppressor of tub2 mutation [Vezdaea aestivalis]|nr:MAG: suppressor of tub2 mutation [Vezdaea aestivalis]
MAAKLYDASGTEALALVRDPNITNEVKLERLQTLKNAVKHNQIPEASIQPIFHICALCLTQQFAILSSAGFTLLSNVLKRLHLQEPHFIIPQAPRLLPLVLERFGDPKERNRDLARQVLTDIWRVCPLEVENAVRDSGLASKGVYMKQTSMIWISRVHQEHHLNFKAFVPKLMDALEDADGMVRDTAKVTVVDLFRTAPDHAQADLKKQLISRQVRKTIAGYILAQLELPTEPQPSRNTDRPISSHSVIHHPEPHNGTSATLESSRKVGPSQEELPPPKPVEQGIAQTVHTQKELEGIIREMQPCFEGKESEHNWLSREKTIIKLGNITRGNAPQDFPTAYIAGVKTLLDGILKTVDSLRTTVSSNGCQLVQEITRTAGPGIDSMVDILLQRLIKLCGGTKKISAANGDATVNVILANVSYHLRILQYILSACQDKNIQPRRYATGWVRTILDKYGSHKHHLEHGGGADILQKCVVRGLEDSDKDVRESMRRTYWKYASIWPEKAESIMASLSPNYKKLLENHIANPNPSMERNLSSSGSQKVPFSRSTTAFATTKPSLKEVMAAQKAAVAKQRQLPARPGSALSTFSPEKVPAPAVSGGLNSKPVRPMKTARRMEVPRPATADPYSIRRKPGEMPSATPGIGSARPRSKLPSPLTSPSRFPMKNTKAGTPVAPRLAQSSSRPGTEHSSPAKPEEDLTLVIPSLRPTSKGSVTSNASVSTLSNDPLRVYEDPALARDRLPSPVQPFKNHTQVLHELTPSDPGHPNLPSSGRPHSLSETKQSGAQFETTQESFLKTLRSGIPSIAAGKLDIYGFRRIQLVLKSRFDFGTSETSFETFLSALLTFIDSPLKAKAPPQEIKKSLDLRSQALNTLRDVQAYYPADAAPHAGPALCRLLHARKHYPENHHITMIFSQTTDELLRSCPPESTISAILSQLDSPPAPDKSTLISVKSVQTLLALSLQAEIHLNSSTISLIGKFIVEAIQSDNPDVRKAVTATAPAFHGHAKDDMWALMEDAPEKARNLIAWSVAKSGTIGRKCLLGHPINDRGSVQTLSSTKIPPSSGDESGPPSPKRDINEDLLTSRQVRLRRALSPSITLTPPANLPSDVMLPIDVKFQFTFSSVGPQYTYMHSVNFAAAELLSQSPNGALPPAVAWSKLWDFLEAIQLPGVVHGWSRTTHFFATNPPYAVSVRDAEEWHCLSGRIADFIEEDVCPPYGPRLVAFQLHLRCGRIQEELAPPYPVWDHVEWPLVEMMRIRQKYWLKCICAGFLPG